MLILPIKRKWLSMILSGEKGDEYRDIKPYWTVRIRHWLGFSQNEESVMFELLRSTGILDAKPVILQNGYGKGAVKVKVLCTLSIGTGKAEWGAQPGTEYYRFKVEEIYGKE